MKDAIDAYYSNLGFESKMHAGFISIFNSGDGEMAVAWARSRWRQEQNQKSMNEKRRTVMRTWSSHLR